MLEEFPELREKSALGGGLAVYEWVERPPDFAPLYTADVDLVIEMAVEKVYPHLRAELLSKEYTEWKEEGRVVEFSFGKRCQGANQNVRIDFQGPDHAGGRLADRGETLCPIGDLKARALVGGILAVHESEVRRLEGIGPAGGRKSGEVRVIKPFMLAMLKAIAFEKRGRRMIPEGKRARKDAADLYALLRYAPGGPEGLAEVAKRFGGREVVQDGVRSMRRYFTVVDGEGSDTLIEYFRDGAPRPADQMRRELAELARAFVEEFDRR